MMLMLLSGGRIYVALNLVRAQTLFNLKQRFAKYYFFLPINFYVFF
jgi:hypothetical protein